MNDNEITNGDIIRELEEAIFTHRTSTEIENMKKCFHEEMEQNTIVLQQRIDILNAENEIMKKKIESQVRTKSIVQNPRACTF